MPTAVRELAVAAIAARLATVPGSPTIRRNPATPADAGNAVDLYEGDQDVAAEQAAVKEYSLAIELELFAVAGAAINELYAQTLKHLLADGWWPTGAGIADLREESMSATQLDTEDGHDAMAGYLLRLTLNYWTDDKDPFTPAP